MVVGMVLGINTKIQKRFVDISDSLFVKLNLRSVHTQMYMNSTVSPDSVTPETSFRDSIIADKAIETLRRLRQEQQQLPQPIPFLLSVGFKLPHTQYHVPRRYFDWYADSPFLASIRDSASMHNYDYNWSNSRHANHTSNVNLETLRLQGRFPAGAPRMNYRCCAQEYYRPMEQEGRLRSRVKRQYLYALRRTPAVVRYELMRGYLAGVSFLDAQVNGMSVIQ